MRNLALPVISALTLSVIVLPGCSSIAYDIDDDAAAEVAPARNFAFVQQDSPMESELTSHLIKQAIHLELEEHGIEEVDTRPADLLVSYRYQKRGPTDAVSFSDGSASFGGGTGSTVMSMTPEPREPDLQPAELVIEVMDSDSRDIVWKASALMDLSDRHSDERKKQVITDVVDQMFQKFPDK